MEHKPHNPISIIVILFVILFGTVFLLMHSDKNKLGSNQGDVPIGTTTAPAYKCGLTVTSPLPNSTVSFPLTVTGVINNPAATDGCTWTMFEGQAGNIVLSDQTTFYSVPSGSATPVSVTGDWMANVPVSFSTTLTPVTTIPSGTQLSITFNEEDPSGQGLAQTLVVPVIAQ